MAIAGMVLPLKTLYSVVITKDLTNSTEQLKGNTCITAAMQRAISKTICNQHAACPNTFLLGT